MANAVYTKFKENLLAGLFDLDTNTIKAALIDSYTPNLATHATQADAKGAGAVQVGTDQTLTGKAVTNGAFTASTVTWTSVAGGNTPDYVLVYQDGAGDSTRYLIALIDTTTGVTLPVTTNGGNVTLTWSTSVFTL
jgi:hypothetical protein